MYSNSCSHGLHAKEMRTKAQFIRKKTSKSFFIQLKCLHLSQKKNGAVLAESGNSSNFNEIPRTASSSNGGPRLRVAFMPVDYKGGEHSKLVFRSFVTPQARLFSYKGDYLIRETVSFFISINLQTALPYLKAHAKAMADTLQADY